MPLMVGSLMLTMLGLSRFSYIHYAYTLQPSFDNGRWFAKNYIIAGWVAI